LGFNAGTSIDFVDQAGDAHDVVTLDITEHFLVVAWFAWVLR
jgi:hypothetical protein